MSFLKFFSGPTPEKLEKKGDALFKDGSWGQAKLEYERALLKAQKGNDLSPDWEAQLSGKIAESKEALAKVHQKGAEDLIEGGYYDDARPLISLAMEITSDEARTRALAKLLKKLESLQQADAEKDLANDYYVPADEQATAEPYEVRLDDQYHALCGTLPPEIQETYLSYGENFKKGYLALNTEDFETAATYLSRAMAENPDPGSYIPLELATAYLHLGKPTEARQLLVRFLEHHSEALPVYQLLCDIYWEEKDFQRADALIDSVPENLADSVAVHLLRGETRYHAGEFEEAKALYQTLLDDHGWQETIAIALAKANEALGEIDNARRIYQEIMGHCVSCSAKINPEIKHKYAELSFAAGIYDSNVLKLYLALAQEIPHNAPAYYDKVSRIYAAQENETEAARFRSIAEMAAAE
ncbi:MAG: tetratricopeptide repeat protein [Deltaproteobacteria bacterium]|nr:tetratricopeptide repeat protein [Deltaproteobacteria bacterium]MBW1719192.1 tetratricopeptide repeat protein [Deltaproteobacteria bacterium]MBW2080683.1 tetratricopeptide repeat protein [Deltaproteobacteria bacterium]